MRSKKLAKKAGEHANLPDEELHGAAQPAFDRSSKKQPKSTSRKQPKSASTGKQPQPPVQAATMGADVGTPQYPPPGFPPSVENDGTASSWQAQFPPMSSIRDGAHPHSFVHYYPPSLQPTPFITPSQVASSSSSSFPQSSAYQWRPPPPTSQVPSFSTSSNQSHFTSLTRSIPPIQVPAITHGSLYSPVPETDPHQLDSYHFPHHTSRHYFLGPS